MRVMSTAFIFAYRALSVLRVLFIILSLSLLPGLIENLTSPYSEDFGSLDNPRVNGQFVRMQSHLEGPKAFSRLDDHDRKRVLTACSLAAQSLWSLDRAIAGDMRSDQGRRKEIREMILNLAETVLRPSLLFTPDVTVTKFPSGGYSAYYGPVNVVLVIHRLLTGSTRWDREIEHVTTYLWRESLRWPSGMIPPLAPAAQAPAFTADQSVVLYGMNLVQDLKGAPSPPAEPSWSAPKARPVPKENRARKKKEPVPGLLGKTPVVPQLVENPRRPWRLPEGQITPLQVFAQALAQNPVSRRSGLYPAGINHEHSDLPRGSSTTFTLIHLARAMPEGAESMYTNFRSQMFRRAAVGGGFREWPVGLERGQDDESGSIIWKIGMASSIYGLASARRFGDVHTYDAILRFTNWMGGYWEIGQGRRYLAVDLPMGFMKGLFPSSRGRYESMQFLADASLFRAFTLVPEVRRGGEDGRYRDRRWPWTEAILLILGMTGFFSATQGRRHIDDWLNRREHRAPSL